MLIMPKNKGLFHSFKGYEAERGIADSINLKKAQSIDFSTQYPVGNFSNDISGMTLDQLYQELERSKAELPIRAAKSRAAFDRIKANQSAVTEEMEIAFIWAAESVNEVYYHIQDIENRIQQLNNLPFVHPVESRSWVQSIIGNEFGPFSDAANVVSQVPTTSPYVDPNALLNPSGGDAVVPPISQVPYTPIVTPTVEPGSTIAGVSAPKLLMWAGALTGVAYLVYNYFKKK